MAWQHEELTDRYNLFAVDPGGCRYDAVIYKPSTSVGGLNMSAELANQTDFENNYKTNSNYAIGVRAYPFATPDVQFAGEGVSGVALKNATTDIWIKLANAFYLSGGEYFTVGSVAGDTLQVDVVDKDGIYYPAGTVLVSPAYMKSWNIPPADGALFKFERSYSAKPPANVYLRFRYTSIGTVNDVKFYANIYLHKPL